MFVTTKDLARENRNRGFGIGGINRKERKGTKKDVEGAGFKPAHLKTLKY